MSLLARAVELCPALGSRVHQTNIKSGALMFSFTPEIRQKPSLTCCRSRIGKVSR